LISAVSTATALVTAAATNDVQWPLRGRPDFRILESWSGHLCSSFGQPEDVDPDRHRGFGDWRCVHGAVVWHWELDCAAERARVTLEGLGLR
jgi:hypothetical protein